MATNQDFDDLIDRITTATNTLETDVGTISTSAEALDTAVTEAETYATTATTQASNAATSATEASNYVTVIEGKITDLENAVILEEAPEDGNQYARQDGGWTVVAGADGVVTSVNSVTPNSEGELTLTASDVGAKDSSYTPTWSEVTSKPSFSTVATTGSYNDLSSTPTLGTVAPLAVTTSTSDTTTTSVPTVGWVQANSGGGEAGVRPGGNASEYQDSVFIFDCATMYDDGPAFASAVDIENNIGRSFPVWMINSDTTEGGSYPPIWYVDADTGGGTKATEVPGRMTIEAIASNSGTFVVNSYIIYLTIHSDVSNRSLFGKTYVRKLYQTSKSWSGIWYAVTADGPVNPYT